MKKTHRTIKTVAGILLLVPLLALVTACSCREKETAQTSSRQALPRASAPPSPSPAPATAENAEGEAFLTARIRAVSLSGKPVAGMIPIATLEANAFDKPIATGMPTGADGMGVLRFPSSKKVALRAWDPELRFFPNNFLEVLPNSGVINEVLEVTMVQSGILFAKLLLPDGLPARNENAGIMLLHPVHGPWWPAESNTSDAGEVVFESVPPGKFVLRLKVASGPSIEVAETYIAPGEPTSLGTITLNR